MNKINFAKIKNIITLSLFFLTLLLPISLIEIAGLNILLFGIYQYHNANGFANGIFKLVLISCIIFIAVLNILSFNGNLEEFRFQSHSPSTNEVDLNQTKAVRPSKNLEGDLYTEHLKPVFSTNGADGDSVQDRYSKRFQRAPPSRFDLWLDLAAELNCTTDMQYYDQMMRDLSPFQSGIKQESLLGLYSVWEELRLSMKNPNVDGALHHFVYKVSIKDGKLENSPRNFVSVIFGNGRWPKGLLFLDFEMIFSALDCPLMVNSESPYDGTRRLLDIENACVQTVYQNKLVNSSNYVFSHEYLDSGSRILFGQAKGLCFSDILLPLEYHVNQADFKMPNQLSFRNKIPAAFFRGSPTGIFH